MPDAIPPTTDDAPDDALVLGPADTATLIAALDRPGRRGRVAHETIYAVVHRSAGVWTHVYRVSREDAAAAPLVHVEKVYRGERVAEARAWIAGRLATLAGGGRPASAPPDRPGALPAGA